MHVHEAEHDPHPRVGRVSDDIGDRYGRTRVKRWPIVAGGVVAVAAAVWLGWAIWGQSNPDVTSSLVSFRVTDAHRAAATVEVRLKSADTKATCVLQATARDHSVVGEVHFDVPHDQGKHFTLTRELRTERQATAVISAGCTAPGQARPR
jgi:hypothetical protein